MRTTDCMMLRRSGMTTVDLHAKPTDTKGQSVKSALPAIEMPDTLPCEGVLHYELEYGPPGIPLYRRVREFVLELEQVRGAVTFAAKTRYEKDTPIKKRGFSQPE